VLSHRRALVERKMNGLQVGEVTIGAVRGIKPYGAFIDIGGVSGLLHISEISHDHIDTPHSVFAVNDELKVMIIDLDAERGRISLSTKQLEPEPGDMLKNREVVFEKAEEMAEKYRQKLLQQERGETARDEPARDEPTSEVVEETEIPSATDEEVTATVEETENPEPEAIAEVEVESEAEEVASETEASEPDASEPEEEEAIVEPVPVGGE
ncbi:MAG: S1 RNA-binding domain-containing protein, partial [Spirulina sp.]